MPPAGRELACLSGGVHEPPAENGPEAATCSALSRRWSEPLPGTAAVATTWLCLEQRGPWGSDALLHSHLDTAVGEALAGLAQRGVRVQLLRRPGRHADTGARAPRRVYLARTRPERSWLRIAETEAPAELLDLDFERIAAGEHDGWGEPASGPLLLVCTNGRRDRCCAVRGRPLAGGLADRHGDAVWETNHTGGHRFAPAAVLLPSGYTYGHLEAGTAEAALAAAEAGEVAVAACRGRSTWSRPGQAAELAVREHIGEHLVDALHVEGEEGGEVLIAHQDGRRWSVTVKEEALSPPRPNSCGKAPVQPSAFTAVQIVGY